MDKPSYHLLWLQLPLTLTSMTPASAAQSELGALSRTGNFPPQPVQGDHIGTAREAGGYSGSVLDARNQKRGGSVRAIETAD
jgi:hypothetical protein